MKTNNFKAVYKTTQLISILSQSLAGKMNMARVKFFGLFICSLCKVQTVNFCKLATAFETPAKSGSALRRVQRFMAGYALDSNLIARLIFKILPHKPPFKLVMDRTSWKFGKANINVLTLAIAHVGAAFPILISMLDKRGNSHTRERVEIINRYVELFGEETIDCLLADREFIGKHWINWLNQNGIRYYIRIRENFWVENPRNGKRFKAFWAFNDLRRGESKVLYPIYRVNGQLCYLAASKIIHNKIPELQIIISFNKPENA
ncbi:MAG: IS4 family transposase, partial [Prevotellaceae bacterium]|nr:IS4 family transposase [Prevotellaceae bacterium]